MKEKIKSVFLTVLVLAVLLAALAFLMDRYDRWRASIPQTQTDEAALTLTAEGPAGEKSAAAVSAEPLAARTEAPVTAPVPDKLPAADPGTEEWDHAVPVPEKAEYERGYIRLSMPLYEGWEYETVETEDYSGIRFWRAGDREHCVDFFWWRMFGVCGTGLTETEADFPEGLEAKLGFYDGRETWSFVYFYNAPGDYAANNNGLEGEDAETAMRMLRQASLGTGLTRAEALEIAEKQAEHDSYTHPAFDPDTGSWTVNLRKKGQDTPAAVVTIGPDGTVLP